METQATQPRKISVTGIDGAVLGETYAKRARQMVKNGRAKWIGESEVRMLPEFKKELKLVEDTVDLRGGTYNSNGAAKMKIKPESADGEIKVDRDLMHFAREKVSERKKLIGKLIAIFETGAVVLFAIIAVRSYNYFFALCIAAYFGFRLLMFALSLKDYVDKFTLRRESLASKHEREVFEEYVKMKSDK